MKVPSKCFGGDLQTAKVFSEGELQQEDAEVVEHG
jgi:hypothetical protein